MPDLGSTLSLNASKFAEGIAQARAKLTELNTALIENRQKMKEVSKEAQELQKQEKALTDAMKDGGTKEQQEELGRLRDRIGQVNAELGTLKTRERELQGDISKATKELNEQKNGADALKNSTDGAAAALKKLETGLKAVLASTAGKKLFDILIGSNADMEQYITSFSVMLGDAEKAQQLMKELNTMAAKTPMELTDVVSAGTLLMNYGVEAEKLIDTMTQLGDLAAGNAQKFERVSLAYGQMLAKGKVSGEELRQMTEAGVPLLQALADELKLTTGEVQDLVSKGKVGIPELNAAIASMTTGTGQFAGMMEKQSETFSGMLSTLSDEAKQFGREVGEETFGVVKESLSELLEMIDEWRDDGTLSDIAKDLGTTVGSVAKTLKTVITLVVECRGAILPLVSAFAAYKAAIKGISIIEGVKESVAKFNTLLKAEKVATEGATVAQEGLNTAMAANPIGLVAAAVAALTVGMIELSNWIGDCNGRAEKLNEEAKKLSDSAEEYSSKASSLKDIKDRYEEIERSEKGAQEKGQELKILQDELISQYGDQASGIDLVNGELEEQRTLLDGIINDNKELARVNAEAALAKAKAAEKEGTSVTNDAFNVGDAKIAYDAQQWAAGNLSTFDAAASMFGSAATIKRIELKGTFEEKAKDLKALYDHLVNDLGLDASNSFVSNVLEQLNNISKSADDLKKLEDAVNGVGDAEEKAAKKTAAAEKVLGDNASVSAEQLKKLADAMEETDKSPDAIKERSDAVDGLVKQYSSLYDTLKDVEKGDAISYEKMQSLLRVYPDLAKHIIVTADGYKIEQGALGDLSAALDDSVTAQVDAEKAKTEAAIKGSKTRIKLYIQEMETYFKLGDTSKANELKNAINTEYAAIAEFEKELSTYDTLPKYVASNHGSGSSKSSGSSGSGKDTPPGFKSLMGYAKTASAAFKEMNENGELTLSTVQALIDAGYTESVVHKDAAGRWVIEADEYEKAANAQITAAQGVKDVTAVEIDALESLREKLTEVKEGTYGLTKETKELLSVGDADKTMSTLSSAFAEQKNGSLSAKTISSLESAGYKDALVSVNGQVKLDSVKVSDNLKKELDAAIKDLKEQASKASKDALPAIQAQIQAYKDLKKAIGDVTDGLYGVEKAQKKIISDTTLKDEETAQNKRLKAIDAELKAKQKLRDETLKAIDDEVQARKRLTEDNDIQRQIDQVMAQLKYSQLDDYSRAQLERKMQSLQNDKADMLWQRGIEDRRAAANDEYNAAAEQLNAEKDSINERLEVLRKLNQTVNDGLTNIETVIKEAMEKVKPGSTTNVNFYRADSLSETQVVQLIKDNIGDVDAI